MNGKLRGLDTSNFWIWESTMNIYELMETETILDADEELGLLTTVNTKGFNVYNTTSFGDHHLHKHYPSPDGPIELSLRSLKQLKSEAVRLTAFVKKDFYEGDK